MKLSYNVTGTERKSLVGAISTALNAPTKYLGAPTFAYEVGDYHIDKTGTLTGADNLDLEDTLHQAGFDSDGDTREYEEPDTYESGLGGMAAMESHEELGMTPAYEDLNMTEEEELGLGRTRRESFQGENGMRANDIPDADELDLLTVEFPRDGFNPETLDNLTKMVMAKEALIKAALNADDLPIRMTEETVAFPWFTLSDPSEAAYYVQFIFALCKTAKEKKRVTAKERELADNPKYAMRCWLLSLGLIGDEFKNARKLLLARLGGNSSFKGGSRPTYTAHLYTYPTARKPIR